MRHFAYATLCALMLAPAVAADWYEGKPDCPPDMFCTESVGEGNETDEPVVTDLPEDTAGEEAQSGLAPAGEKASGFAVVIGLAALALVALRR